MISAESHFSYISTLLYLLQHPTNSNQEWDIRNTQSIEESVRHSDVVFNLVGRDYPTKNFTLEDVHVEGTERIVEAVAKYDVDRYIHVSSFNADVNSPSEFFRTKGRAEQIARQIYPETTIVRPAPLFGFEDRLLHRLAGVVNFITSNWMQERYWPVHAPDVGKALEKIMFDDSTAGETFELYGPTNYSTKELSEIVDREIIKIRRHINVPKRILQPLAKLANQLIWWKVGSADQIEREFIDQKIDRTAKTFKDLGIEPAELRDLTFYYLVSSPAGDGREMLMCDSNNTAAHRTLTCLPRRTRRSASRGSTSTFWTTNRSKFTQPLRIVHSKASTPIIDLGLENILHIE